MSIYIKVFSRPTPPPITLSKLVPHWYKSFLPDHLPSFPPDYLVKREAGMNVSNMLSNKTSTS